MEQLDFIDWLRAKLGNNKKAEEVIKEVEDAGFDTEEGVRGLTDAQLFGWGFRDSDIKRVRGILSSPRPSRIENVGPVLAQAIGGSIIIENANQTINNVVDGWTEAYVMELETVCKEKARMLDESTLTTVLNVEQELVEKAIGVEREFQTQRKRIVKKVPPLLRGSDVVIRLTAFLDAALSRFKEYIQQLEECAGARRVMRHLKDTYEDAKFRIKDFGRETKLGERGMGFSFVKVRVAQWNEKAEHAAVKGDKEAVNEALEKGTREINLKELWQPQRATAEVGRLTKDAPSIAFKRIVIQGKAGAGKTTLLKRVAYEWSRQQLWRDQFDVVVFIRLRDVPEKNRETLEDMLSSQMLSGEAKRSIPNFVAWCERHSDRVLWLLDGWDEIHIKCGVLKRIQDSVQVGVQYLVAGCRPEAVVNFKGCDSQLTVEGFTPKGVQQFIRLYFGEWDPYSAAMTTLLCLKHHESQEMRELYRHFRKQIVSPVLLLKVDASEGAGLVRAALHHAPWLSDACRLPLMLMLVCTVAPKLGNATKKTDIYKLVVDHEMNRFAEVSGIPAQKKFSKVSKTRTELQKVAWKSFRERRLILSEEEICENPDVADSLKMCGLLKEEGCMEGTSSVSYSWPHFTIQEYLAAEHVCNSKVFDGNKLVDELREVMKFPGKNVFFGFVCGIGGRARDGWDQWYPTEFGNLLMDVLVDAGPVLWIEEGGKDLEQMLETHWKGKLDGILLRTAAFEGCRKAVEFFIRLGVDVNSKGRSEETSLHLACEKGHLDVILFLIENKAEVNAKGHDGFSALVRAISSGHLDVVRLLIECKADLTEKDDCGMTLLHFACSCGFLNVFRVLIEEFKVDVKSKVIDVRDLLEAACIGGHLEIVRVLIEEYKADVNAKDDCGTTSFHFACYLGHLDVVRVLIEEYKANVNAKDDCGKSSLHYALHDRHLEVVSLLIEKKADMNAKKKDGFSPLYDACQKGDVEVVRLLIKSEVDLNSKEEDGSTPLYFACRYGHLEVAKLLVEGGSDVNATDNYGVTSLHAACMGGHLDVVRLLIEEYTAGVNASVEPDWTPLHCACQEGYVEVIRVLIESGANIKTRGETGVTPLHCACLNGKLDVVRLMIGDYEADVNAKDDTSLTPLHFACQPGHLDVVWLLIENGAEVNATCTDGRTPLHFACDEGHLDVVRLLIKNGANLNMITYFGASALHYACRGGHRDVAFELFDKYADMNAKNLKGWTALLLASENGHVEVVRFLIAKGAIVNVTDDDLQTPLHCACEKGHLEVVRVLIENGADVNAKMDGELTPLHTACHHGYFEVVRLLIEYKAEVNAKVTGRWTPLRFAAERSHEEIEHYLIDNGALLETNEI